MVDNIIRKYKLIIDKIIILHEQSTDINLTYQIIKQKFEININEFIEIYNNLFIDVNT